MSWSEKRRQIKQAAKQAVAKNIKLCMGVTLVILILWLVDYVLNYFFAPSILTISEESLLSMDLGSMISLTPSKIALALLLNIIAIFLQSPANIGSCQVFLGLARGTGGTLRQMLNWYTSLSRSLRAIGLFLVITLLTLLWQILLIGVPLVAAYLLQTAEFSLQDISLYITLSSLTLTLAFAGGIFASVIVMAYEAAQYVMADRQVTVFQSLKRSIRLMKGHKWEFFVFQLSFLGWYLLAFCSFGLAYIYLYPYESAATAIFMADLMEPE